MAGRSFVDALKRRARCVRSAWLPRKSSDGQSALRRASRTTDMGLAVMQGQAIGAAVVLAIVLAWEALT